MQTLSRLALLAVLVAGCEPDVATPKMVAVVVALFDPLATPPVVPTPNDLAFTGGDGVHLNVPDNPTDAPAQRAFNAYLRTLTGFPASSTATASFSKPLDAARVTLSSPTSGAGALVVVDTTVAAPLGPDMVAAMLSGDGKTIDLTPAQRWTPGHRYAVLVFGGADPAGLRGAGGETVLASPSFFFLRSPNPLVARCTDPVNPDCACPPDAVANPSDTSCHSVVLGLPDATARVVEPQRRMLQTALGTLLPLVAPGRSQNDLVLFWTFTITTQPMTVFDPTRGNVPFPNDALIDPMTGRVNLPIAAGDPQAAVKMALNTLDGFSESAPETVAIDGPAPLDPRTILPDRSVFLINLDPRPSAEKAVYTAAFAGGELVLAPQMPLESDQDKYAVVVTSNVTDANGQPLLPAPTMVLATGENPLFDGMHSTVSVLDDAQAMQLEALRTALQPLIAKLAAMGLPRSSLAALWTFTTQSIARPLAALDAFPVGGALPTDVTIVKVASATDIAASPLATLLPDVGSIVIGSFTSKNVVDPTTRLVSFTGSGMTFTVQPPAGAAATTIRFWLALPKLPATGAVPVAIMQHGLTSWRGDVLPLAEGAAKGGWASVGFDIDFHGSRSKCTADNQCASGACNVATGACPGGFVTATTAMDPLTCDLAALSGDLKNDCKPAISGQNYIDATNLFSGRSNGYQYVVDASQLVRVLSDTTNANGLAAQLAAQTVPVTPTLDVTKLGFLGQSLGAIDGAVFLAGDQRPKVGVLNVGGGHVFEIIADGAFHSLVDQYLTAIGVMRGTPAYAQLVATARWVLDPVDPFSVAPLLRNRPIINQEAGMDTVIPPIYEEDLAIALYGPTNGVDAMHHARGALADRTTFFSVYYPAAMHGSLLTGTPTPDATNMQADAFGYLLSFGTAQ